MPLGTLLMVASAALLACEAKLVPTVIPVELGRVVTGTVDMDSEILYQIAVEKPVVEQGALRIYTEGFDVDSENPLLVVVRFSKGVLSWQIPLLVKQQAVFPKPEEGDSEDEIAALGAGSFGRGRTLSLMSQYFSINRTLCPGNGYPVANTLRAVPQLESVIVSFSTGSVNPVNFKFRLYAQEEFQLSLGEHYESSLSPSAPIYYKFGFPDGIDSVLLTLHSEDHLCMTLSVQNVSCPVFDLDRNVAFEGIYQTVDLKGGLTFTKESFPYGVFIVLVVKADDLACQGSQNFLDSEVTDVLRGFGRSSRRLKSVRLHIKESVSKRDYLIAAVGTVIIFATIYTFVMVVSCAVVCRKNRARASFKYAMQQNQARVNAQEIEADNTGHSDQPEANTAVANSHNRFSSIEVDPNELEEQERGQNNESAISNHGQDPDAIYCIETASRDSSLDETEIDMLPDAEFEKDIIRTKQFVTVADLARKSHPVLTRKSNLYFWNLITVCIFYGLPVAQLVLTYQLVTNTTGNQDLCYFNFLCAHPWGILSDFNHVFSNLGYILLGLLFMFITQRKESLHNQHEMLWVREQRKNTQIMQPDAFASPVNRRRRREASVQVAIENGHIVDNVEDILESASTSIHEAVEPKQPTPTGIPQHFGMYYAMGLALIMEGLMSACYHVCPNHTNFQFDTAFMYTISILILLKIYQTRHPDINANAYMAFGALAFIICIGVIGVINGSLLFWIIFTVLHVLSCLYLSVQVYHMSRWSCPRLWMTLRNDTCCLFQGNIRALKPKYPDRFILLVILNLVNWGLDAYGLAVLAQEHADFAGFLLSIFIANVMLYTLFYLAMKLSHKERIMWQTGIYLSLSFVTWMGAMYFFINKSTTWVLTPAQSKHLNQECRLFHFYDNHDIWHFLSACSMFLSFMVLLTWDDDLIYTPRDQIPVF